MKKWTKKFLKQIPLKEITVGNILLNAIKAEKKLGIPQDLWLELSDPHVLVKESDKQSAFMAGVAIGWAEKNNKIS